MLRFKVAARLISLIIRSVINGDFWLAPPAEREAKPDIIQPDIDHDN